MTKIKNTKKGMAKKTLSMSLVVAMLATSNVPVWATDAFSDGSDVSAFTAEAEAPTVEDTEGDIVDNATASSITGTVEFKENGEKRTNEVVANANTTFSAWVTLSAATNATIRIVDEKNNTIGTSKTYTNNPTRIDIAYTLTQNDIGKTFSIKVTDGTGNDVNITSPNKIKIVEKATVLTGIPTIDAGEAKNNVIIGTILTAKTDNVGPAETTLHYQWQVTDKDGNWTNIPGQTNPTYTVGSYFGKKVRVAVYAGDNFEEDKAAHSDAVVVGARKLANDDTKGGIVTADTKIDDSIRNNGKQFSTNAEKNKLSDKEITVKYKQTSGTVKELVYGQDYTLTYDQLDHLGDVNVTVTILPTETTNYTSDVYNTDKTKTNLKYTLTAIDAADYTINYNKDKKYEYTGQKITPEVTSVTYEDKAGVTNTLPKSDYTVQTIGPDAGKYALSVATTDGKIVFVKNVSTSKIDMNAVEIEAKNMAKHNADFDVVIPEEVWKASEADVTGNKVKNAKIKLYDTAADPNKTNDLLASGGFKISCVNWSEYAIQKTIRISAISNANYAGSIDRDGEATKSDINDFKTAFYGILAAGRNKVYNGTEQDYLGELLKTNPSKGSITLNGKTLYLNKDFTYKLIQGGTNAGYVSYTITGAGDYANTEMILSNVYEIQPAVFNGNAVKDNTTNNVLSVPFNPALGDKGADITNYNILAKDVYKAWIVDDSNNKTYDLVLDKDFWLDRASVSEKELKYMPTVAEKTKFGHGKNENFVQTTGTDRASITAKLTEKDLSDKDITVKVVDASYNNGAPVIPTVKVVYTAKDGKEYEISKDYYTVETLQSATNEGGKGKINVKAKIIANADKEKYPQMYKGNQMVEYTVGTPSLEGGKIVATNGLETLPSVAYSAEQAASTKGIILEAGKYVVKDKSGNVVDPKYYDVTFSDNKKAGTATITVTGKAPYKGSVSANFKITNAALPSGTVTLMSDKLSKTYTGEEISLVKGTDYAITGELAQLKEGTDYMVSYENAVNVTTAGSKAKIKFVGIGSYAGELVKTFDITPAKITASDVTLGDTTYSSGMTVKPSVTITVPGGKTALVEGTDYTVDYVPAATNVGDKGKVVITYKDNKNLNTADSVKEVEYGVTAKDLKDVTVAAIANQEATGEQIKPAVTVMNGSVKLTEGKDYEVVYGDNKAIGEGTVTVKALDSNKNYTGSQTVKFNIVESAAEIGTPVISSVKVVGNKATVILSGDAEGASGYDYVISTDKDCTTSKDYDAISKNQVKTSTAFKYVQKGTYYAYCHAWTRDKNGKKVFGEWSEGYEFKVKATTPAAPVITEVKVKGSTITVTYNKVSNVAGYDVVLGTSSKNDNGELRPYRYGDHKILNINKNKVTVQFKNVPKKNWVVGMRSFTKDPDTNKKVFSRWSNLMPANVE